MDKIESIKEHTTDQKEQIRTDFWIPDKEIGIEKEEREKSELHIYTYTQSYKSAWSTIFVLGRIPQVNPIWAGRDHMVPPLYAFDNNFLLINRGKLKFGDFS